jgi:anti-sigma B factor antagonist
MVLRVIATRYPPFTVSTTRTNGLATVRVRGELDMATEAEFLSGLMAALATGPAAVVLDLSELSFVDVIGVRALLTACDSCVNQGKQVSVTGAAPRIRRVFALCGVELYAATTPGRRGVFEGAGENTMASSTGPRFSRRMSRK